MVAVCPQFGVSARQARDWLADMQKRSERGAFYYALPWTYFAARAV